MPCECFYGGIREKSIGYPMKVYRVFPESLQSFPKKSREYFQKVYRPFSDLTVQMIRYLPSSVPLLWDNRFASSHPPILRSVSFVEMLCILPFSVPTSPIPRSDTFVQKPRFLPSSSPTSLTLSAGSLPTNNLITPHSLPYHNPSATPFSSYIRTVIAISKLR